MSGLEADGFEFMVDYASVEVLHDVHGLEVCGIRNAEDAMTITRLLMRIFPGWTPGWLHHPDAASEQSWIASIQRDRDQIMECWNID